MWVLSLGALNIATLGIIYRILGIGNCGVDIVQCTDVLCSYYGVICSVYWVVGVGIG